MKKFLYSNYTKTIAVLLFIISIVLGALTVTGGIAEYCNERELIYGFESDFNEADSESADIELESNSRVDLLVENYKT